MIFVNGNFVDLRPDSYYGGRNERGILEYLYRMPDGRWFLHTVNVGMQKIADLRGDSGRASSCLADPGLPGGRAGGAGGEA
jgi:hypothetical protein